MKMKIDTILMFYTAGNAGANTTHREKCHIEIDPDWSPTKKELIQKIE